MIKSSVYKRVLRVLLNDYTSSFEELRHRNEEVTIHEKREPRQLPHTRTKKYGNESLSFRGSIILNQLSDQYKAAKTDNDFKN